MIVVTGGAGFIGSNLVRALNQRGLRDILVVDDFKDGAKHLNLNSLAFADLIDYRDFRTGLWDLADSGIELIFHQGACSDTTERDGRYMLEVNYEYSKELYSFCTEHDVRFVYASSAATYGDGAAGFDDDAGALHTLRPLNLYGWTKHAFDLRVMAALADGQRAPPQWAGLKFFNVYGPNEYHKGRMISVVKVKSDEVAAGRAARLFRSDRDGLADGAQRRDFIWVGDVVDVLLWLLDRPDVTGLFNLGTGTARTYLDLAHAVCDAMGRPRAVEFVDMPPALHGQYQSFTEAPMARLRAAGYAGQFTRLEDGVARYVRDHLTGTEAYV
ncbi:MAG: ADP-glyceromanno-heptose 6-epimerase [Gemmatimonadaceae bacterium]|nr:ADP-glyceromanno-heptose 6-epimerase [Acetobacteraceae bacterium]